MEKKPIKRNEHIMPLSRDHHFSLLFGWKIRQGLKKEVAAGRMVDYVQYFWENNLSGHFKEEEATLFAIAGDDLVKKALADHVAIAEAVAALQNESPDRLPDQLEKLAKMVDAHVRFEEREVFPHLEQTLSDEQLADIGERLWKMHEKNPLKDDYEDEFWSNGRA